jgi:hypothetical protein
MWSGQCWLTVFPLATSLAQQVHPSQVRGHESDGTLLVSGFIFHRGGEVIVLNSPLTSLRWWRQQSMASKQHLCHFSAIPVERKVEARGRVSFEKIVALLRWSMKSPYPRYLFPSWSYRPCVFRVRQKDRQKDKWWENYSRQTLWAKEPNHVPLILIKATNTS